jgi:membrane protease subunit HflK
VLPGGEGMEDAGSVALSDALRSSFLIVRILMAGLLVYFLVSNVRSIGTQERAIILRFGEPVMRDGKVEQGPGLVWAFPYPIDEVVRIPVTELQTVRSSVGWYGGVTEAMEESDTLPDVGVSLHPAREGYLITADGGIMHARATVRYRISEPLKFYLNHRDGALLMTNLVDNALSYAAARFTEEDALRRNITAFREAMLGRLRELILQHDVGVTLEASDIQPRPARQVRADFEAVLTAQEDRARFINLAQSYSNKVVNEARGQAAAVLNAGETDRNRLVQQVRSEAQRFASLLPEYERNPEFYRQRLQTETLRRILTNAQEVFTVPVMADRDEIRVQLNRIPATPKPPAQPAAAPH